MEAVKAEELKAQIYTIDNVMSEREEVLRLGEKLKQQLGHIEGFNDLLTFCLSPLESMSRANHMFCDDQALYVVRKRSVLSGILEGCKLIEASHEEKSEPNEDQVRELKDCCVEMASNLTALQEMGAAPQGLEKPALAVENFCNAINPDDKSIPLSRQLNLLLFAEQCLIAMGQKESLGANPEFQLRF